MAYRGAQGVDPQRIEQIKALYGFDKPAHERFVQMLGQFARFDLGQSFFQNKPVWTLIAEKLPVSISLGLWTFFISYLVAVPLGVAKAVRAGSRFDFVTTLIILVGYAIPGFVLGVALLGAIPGIALAIAVAVIEFLWDGWRPHSAVLGRVDGIKGYHDITRHPQARVVPGLVLFRWDAPLFFANAELFRDRLLDAIDGSPTPVRWLVVGAEPITSVDVTSADVLDELDKTLHEAGIELCFAEMKGPVKDKLKRFGLFSRLGEEHFFATTGEAVSRYLASQRVDWVDWEDRVP
jgi:MFS superfamily sulfate permease-like transporter